MSAASEVVLATASYDHTIRFWEALSGLCVRTIQHPDSQVNRLAISPDKRFLAAAGNPHVRVYEVQTNNPNPVTSFEGHTGNVTAIQYQAAGRWIVTSSEDGTIKIWDVRAPGVQRDYDLKVPVNDVIIHPNQGELISCDQNGAVRIWDLGENACTHELVPEEDTPARSVTMAADGSLLVCANNKGNFYVWKVKNRVDMVTLKAQQRVNAHQKYITKCLLSPDTNLLATCSADHTVKIWRSSESLNQEEWSSDRESGTTSPPPVHSPLSTSISNSNLSRMESSIQRTQSAASVKASSSPRPDHDLLPISRLSSPDSHMRASSQESSIYSANGTPQPHYFLDKTLTGHQRWVWDCAFSADSAYLVTGSSDNTARLWDLSNGDTIRHYNGHQKSVVCVALHDQAS